MGYAVRWAEATDASDEQLDVWNRNLSMKVTPRRRFDWLYRNNPSGPGRLAVLVATDDQGQPLGSVGTAGHGRRAFQVAGRTARAALLCDVAVDLPHRTAMPAFMVTTEMRRHVLAEYDLAYGFPNHLSEPLVTRGYKKMGHTRRFALALRHQRYVKEKLAATATPPMAQPFVAGGAALALDAARAALVVARAAAPALEYRLAWMNEADIDERFDRLWRAAAPDYPIAGVRDTAFVRWRFMSRAEGRLAVVGMIGRKSGDSAGYAAVEQQGDVWHIRDIFAPVAAMPSFLRLLCAALLARGAASVSLRLQAPAAVIEAMQEIGFSERADKRTFVCGVGKNASVNPSEIYDFDRWFLTEADEDA